MRKGGAGWREAVIGQLTTEEATPEATIAAARPFSTGKLFYGKALGPVTRHFS